MLQNLNSKTVLITGAGRGIGKATALLFAKHGATILLVSRTKTELETVAREIAHLGAQAYIFKTDLSLVSNLKILSEKAIEHNIEILINNAGCGNKALFHKISVEDLETTISTNLYAPMMLTKLLLPHFLQKKAGCIINIASIAGKMGMANSVAYCASKHGLVGFSHSLFEEVREKNIKVSVICPGFVDTALIPQTKKIDRNKMIRPEDVASTCLFIATSSPQCCPTEIILRPQNSPYTN